jgi:thioredoxin 1
VSEEINYLKTNFSILSSPLLLLPRCSPCKAIKPVFEELSEKYGDIGFGKVDIDDNQEAATVYQISSVPTFIFFNGGKDNFAGHFSGANKDQLISSIEALDKA